MWCQPLSPHWRQHPNLKAKWVASEKLTSYSFIKTSKLGSHSQANESESESESEGEGLWVLKFSNKVRVKVTAEQLKTFKDQRRADFCCWRCLGLEVI